MTAFTICSAGALAPLFAELVVQGFDNCVGGLFRLGGREQLLAAPHRDRGVVPLLVEFKDSGIVFFEFIIEHLQHRRFGRHGQQQREEVRWNSGAPDVVGEPTGQIGQEHSMSHRGQMLDQSRALLVGQKRRQVIEQPGIDREHSAEQCRVALYTSRNRGQPSEQRSPRPVITQSRRLRRL